MRQISAFAMSLACAGPAASQAAPDPVRFVNQIYAAEIAGKRPEQDMRLFAPELAKLLQRDVAESKRIGEQGAIDYDIICSCQDPSGLRAVPTVIQQAPTSAVVKIRLTFHGRNQQNLTMKLSRSAQGWRIADIVTPGQYGGSLLALLKSTYS